MTRIYLVRHGETVLESFNDITHLAGVDDDARLGDF